MLISSLSNPRIKQIRGLRHRQEREQTGLFFVEGIRPVTEALQLGADVETLVVAPDLLKSPFAQEILRTEQERGTP
jgi:RNA methyltransferase, TrmH family